MFLMVLAPLSGCFGENEVQSLEESSLTVVESDSLEAGMWQTITLDANDDLAVFIPYFIQDPGSMRAQNGTVLDMNSGEQISVNLLLPPRNDKVVFFVGDIGRVDWPIRQADESWTKWLENPNSGSAVQAVENQDVGGMWPWLVPGNQSGGDVISLVERAQDQYDEEKRTELVQVMVGSMAEMSMTGSISSPTILHVLRAVQMEQLAISTAGLEMQTLRMSTQLPISKA